MWHCVLHCCSTSVFWALFFHIPHHHANLRHSQTGTYPSQETLTTYFWPSQPLYPLTPFRLHFSNSWLNPWINVLAGFFGFLRCPKFAPTSSTYNSFCHPSLSAITFHTSDSLIFTLKRSKTDLLGISSAVYLYRLNSLLSPFEPLTRYINSRYATNALSQHPLFITETGTMALFWFGFWFQKHLHKVLHVSGISSEHYSSH